MIGLPGNGRVNWASLTIGDDMRSGHRLQRVKCLSKALLLGTVLLAHTRVVASDVGQAENAFVSAARLPWKPSFIEDGSADWQARWHLDGKKASVEPVDGGFNFSAGANPNDNAHMAVLWTRQSFSGDVRISYDYTRLDDAEHYVTILYVQATGKGHGPYSHDILEWAERREVPAMDQYYRNMNLLHVSYAAFPTPAQVARNGDSRMYMRGRRF